MYPTEHRDTRLVHDSNCRCGAVPKVCAQLGWLQADADEWDVFWSDQSISLARAVAMQPMQVLSVHKCRILLYLFRSCFTRAVHRCPDQDIWTFFLTMQQQNPPFTWEFTSCTGCRKSTILLACWSYAGRRRLHATYQQCRHSSRDTLTSAPRHTCCQRTYHPYGGILRLPRRANQKL